MVILVFKILAIIAFFVSVYTMFCYMELGILFMFLAISLSLMSVLIEDYGLEHIINLFYSTIEWIWDVGKYVLIIFAIIAVLAVVSKLVKNFQSNKIANKRIDIKNKEEQSYKILIIDNNMENLFALKKEKLYEK
ncbi:TPA: hypothetical protein RZK24_001086 [Campylobacter coli]|uniref:hypothetical protein n=2 Tax=Campylobacter coli TaxID=195 RepID=UPI0009316BCA|nr:hypothetical protein [Campylobacter coli]HEB9306459.1 hypothetical protein [Campylobacter coli]HEB9318333.1 hypothetical protein [Campylobacter coli]